MFHQLRVLFCSRLIYIEMEGARVRWLRWTLRWLIRLLSGSGGKEEASRRTTHSDPSFPVETPSTTHYPAARYRYRFKVDAADPIDQTILLIPNRVSFSNSPNSRENFSKKEKRKKERSENLEENFTVYILGSVGDIINGICSRNNEINGDI